MREFGSEAIAFGYDGGERARKKARGGSGNDATTVMLHDHQIASAIASAEDRRSADDPGGIGFVTQLFQSALDIIAQQLA